GGMLGFLAVSLYVPARDGAYQAWQDTNDNGGPSAGTAVCDNLRLVVYVDFFIRHTARPTMPEPKSKRVAGSGTLVPPPEPPDPTLPWSKPPLFFDPVPPPQPVETLS